MRSYENPLVNVAFNIVIPAALLRLLPFPPLVTLGIALAFPLAYGAYDLTARRELNFLSAIGVVSVILTGGIGVLGLNAWWIAVKEASIPLAIAVFVAISARTRDPLVKALLFTDSFLDTKRIGRIVEERGSKRELDRTFEMASYLLAFSFLISTVVNYIIARIFVNAPAGSTLFNEQLGRMTIFSFLVIALPMLVFMVLIGMYIVRRLERITGLAWEELLVAEHRSRPRRTGDGDDHEAHEHPRDGSDRPAEGGSEDP